MSDDWGIEDTSQLTDTDWIELNRLRKIYEEHGEKAFQKSFDELADTNLRCALHIHAAFSPHKVTEAIKDAMANAGITIEDIKELIEKTKPKTTKQ